MTYRIHTESHTGWCPTLFWKIDGLMFIRARESYQNELPVIWTALKALFHLTLEHHFNSVFLPLSVHYSWHFIIPALYFSVIYVFLLRGTSCSPSCSFLILSVLASLLIGLSLKAVQMQPGRIISLLLSQLSLKWTIMGLWTLKQTITALWALRDAESSKYRYFSCCNQTALP